MQDSPKDCKSMLINKIEDRRSAVRAEDHKRLMQQRRKLIINECYPLKSKTFQSLMGTPADQLQHLGSEINSILLSSKLSVQSHNDIVDMIEDLSYLLRQTSFQLENPLKIPKFCDPYIASFVAEFFMVLEPEEVEAWLDCMALDDRKYLYCCLTPEDEQYLTDGLVKGMISDLNEIEVIEFIDEIFSLGKGKSFMRMEFVCKIASLLEVQSKRSILYYRVASHLAVTNPRQGFAIHLVKIIFTNARIATNHELITFAELANDLLTASPHAASFPVMLEFCHQIERRIQIQKDEGSHMILFRQVVKLLVLMVENNRKIGSGYEPHPETLKTLKRVGTTENTETYAKKLLRLVNLQ